MLTLKEFMIMEKVTLPFNPLKHGDLTKNLSRADVFLLKIKNGTEFVLTGGGTATINKKHYIEMEDGFKYKGFSAELTTSKGKVKYPKGFLKTGEFGGRGAGSGVAAENAALSAFNAVLGDILLKEKAPFILLTIGGRTVECAQMVSTEGKFRGKEPKSDMSIVDSNMKPVAWISHKAGSNAKSFQQYGGASFVEFTRDKSLIDFMEKVRELHPEGLPNATTYMRKMTDTKLIRMSVYGMEYGGKRSINNVDEFHQGPMKLKKSGKGYEITSLHKGTNGDIPKTSYEAVYFIRYASRKATAAGVTVDKARVGIFPRAKAGNTTKEI